MDDTWLYLTLAAVGLVLAPALVAGGGFLLALLLAMAVVLAMVGGPKLWELYEKQNLGAKGRNTDIRDLIGTDEVDEVDTGDKR